MSGNLLQFVKDFVKGTIPAPGFADRYIDRYRIERDDGTILADPGDLGECLSTVFCLADLFNPNEDRDEYELNDEQLRRKVYETLSEHHLSDDLPDVLHREDS